MKAFLKELFSFRLRRKWDIRYLAMLASCVALALLVGALIMALTGHDPIVGYRAMLSGALSSQRAVGDTLAKTATLCLTGLAVAVAAQAGIFNVGGEGQLYLGAMAAALVGGYVRGLPSVLGIALSMLAAMLAGGLYAFFPGWLKVRLKVNEVITTIMLNSAAIYFCTFLSNGPLKTGERGIASGTVKIDAAYVFPKVIKLSNLTVSIFLSAGVALIVWYVMKKSVAGYEMKLTGQNERFAGYMGMKTGRLALGAMVASGAICGLVGMNEVFGLHKRFIDSVSNEFYYDGMLVAMIMRYDPLGIIVMSFFFGILKIGATGMEKVGIPSQTILIVQSVVIFFMAAESGISDMLRQRRVRRQAKSAGGEGEA